MNVSKHPVIVECALKTMIERRTTPKKAASIVRDEHTDPAYSAVIIAEELEDAMWIHMGLRAIKILSEMKNRSKKKTKDEAIRNALKEFGLRVTDKNIKKN